jgi:protein-disulfide isomerase
MVKREIALGSFVILGIVVFLFSRTIGGTTATAPITPAAPAKTVTKTNTVSAARTAPTPVKAPTPVVVNKEAPAVVKAPEPKAVKVAPAPTAPTPAKQAVASAVPKRNSDDSPLRTKSGKVKASTNTKLPPAYGPLKSKVHVVIFSDFQCPVCRRAVDATHQIAEEWPGEVRVEFRQNALAMHRNAHGAAVASLAAHRQGKFWDYHDLLFRNQSALDTLSLSAYAQQTSLDMTRFNKDLGSEELKKWVDRDRQFAQDLGARGTPAFLINGKLQVGWGSWNGFRSMVQRELSQVEGLLQQGKTLNDVHAIRAKENSKDDASFKAYKKYVLDLLKKG